MHQMISANFLRICPTFYVFTFLSQSILPECFTASVTFTIFSKSLFISLNFISHFFFLRFFFLSLLLLFFLNFNNYHDVFVLLFFLRVFVAFIFSAVLDIIFFASPSGSIRFFGSLLRSISFKTH